MLRSSRTAKVVLLSDEWDLQNSPSVSRLADSNEVVNSDLWDVRNLSVCDPAWRWR